MALKDIHGPVLKICDYVTVHSKRDFADVTKLKDSEMGRLLDGPSLINES